MKTNEMHRIGLLVNQKELAFMEWLKEEYGAPYSVTIRRGLRKLMECEGFDYQANPSPKEHKSLPEGDECLSPSSHPSPSGSEPKEVSE